MISRIDIEDMTDAQDEARVTVKPLEWRGGYRPGSSKRAEAQSSIAGYFEWSDGSVTSTYGSIFESRAAAEADHRARILSAIVARPSQARDESVARLVKEYRPTMDAEVLHGWAQDVVAALAALDTPKGGGDADLA